MKLISCPSDGCMEFLQTLDGHVFSPKKLCTVERKFCPRRCFQESCLCSCLKSLPTLHAIGALSSGLLPFSEQMLRQEMSSLSAQKKELERRLEESESKLQLL